MFLKFFPENEPDEVVEDLSWEDLYRRAYEKNALPVAELYWVCRECGNTRRSGDKRCAHPAAGDHGIWRLDGSEKKREDYNSASARASQ